MIVDCIRKVVEGKVLNEYEVKGAIDEMVDGRATPSQTAGLLAALRARGETADEVAALAKVLGEMAIRIRPLVKSRIIDTCGTGGDHSMTFNISTVSAFVAAGAGAVIAKHGNRSFTSKCGSADLLEALGYDLQADPELVKNAIEKIGIGFIFAPAFHPVLKNVATVRKELGIRTIFNIMGPLLNPAGANAQLLGVYDDSLVDLMASALVKLGIEEAMVVYGTDGVDEISVSANTIIAHVSSRGVEKRLYSPSDFGVGKHNPSELIVNTKDEAIKSAVSVLKGEERGAKRDAVLVNSAAAIVLSQNASNFKEAVEIARESIDSGRAIRKLKELVNLVGREEVFVDGC
ncbi:MAG: anthranilate phosphoribosyltransferase [Conexivisphaerales archaeon]